MRNERKTTTCIAEWSMIVNTVLVEWQFSVMKNSSKYIIQCIFNCGDIYKICSKMVNDALEHTQPIDKSTIPAKVLGMVASDD